MANHGWMINLSDTIPVFSMLGNGAVSTTQIGKITKNECFADGAQIGAPWEGIDDPVYFLNAKNTMTFGVTKSSDYGNVVDFSAYASNGTSWVKVNTLERKVQYETRAHYADNTGDYILAPGSRVWLTSNCTRGDEHPNYVAVTKVQTADGEIIEFQGNGFVDLTYGGCWVNVGSILLRKA